MKLLCFGDSNTWGYDPRSFLGDRVQHPWPELLAEVLHCTVVNEGQNGRQIPRWEGEKKAFSRFLEQEQPVGLLILMLGTNDLLQGASAEETARRMEVFLRGIRQERSSILLLAPPHLRQGAWVDSQETLAMSRKLGAYYRELCTRLNILFADGGAWEIPLTFDGVHFTEEGHRIFAGKLAQFLTRELQNP